MQTNKVSTDLSATFGIRKMWDDSWKVLEHPEIYR